MPMDAAKKAALQKKIVIAGVAVLVPALGYNVWTMMGGGKKPVIAVVESIAPAAETVHVQASLQGALQTLRDRMMPSEEIEHPPQATPEQMRRLAQKYNASDMRDPFENLLWKDLPSASGLPSSGGGEAGSGSSESESLPTIEIQGVLWGGKDPLVVIEDSLYKVGDTVKGVTIKSIERSGVTVSYGSILAVLTVPRQGAATLPSQSQWR